MNNINKIIREYESQAKGLDFSSLSKKKPKQEQLQRTEKWFNDRRYKFTSSQIFKLLMEPKSAEAKKNGELGETAKCYVMELITEEIGGEIPGFSNQATEWGVKHEEEAKNLYSLKTGNEVSEVGFVQYSEFYGGSPDATVIDVAASENHLGGLEIKCPYNSLHHLKHLLITSQEMLKKNNPEYYWQCVSHMITLNVEWCDFVSYDPRVREDLRLHKLRIWKDQADAKLLLEKIDRAIAFKEEVKKQLGL